MATPTTQAAPRTAAEEPRRERLPSLRALLRFLFGARPEPFDPGSLRLPQYDVPALVEKLAVVKRGEENGRHELPAASSAVFDGPQSEIVQTIQASVLQAQSKLVARLAGLTSRIQQVDLTAVLNDALQLAPKLASDLDTLWARRANRLGPPRQQYDAVRSQYEHFRAEHGLRWDPHYPDSHLLHVAILVVLFVIETWLNSAYFAKASEFGLVGGLTQAAGIAVVNVFSSFVLGRGAAWIRCTRKGFVALGVVCGLLFAGWAIGYNLVVAHVRDLSAASPDASAREALHALRSDPLAFSDATSWLLLLLGGLFCAVAFADGAGWDDPNPGYTRLHRRLRAARADYLHAKQSMLEEALAHRTVSLQRLGALSDRARSTAATLADAVHQKQTLVTQAKTFFEASDGACNALLGRYRDANQRARTTRPPACFQQRYRYDVPSELQPDMEPDRVRLESQQKIATRIEESRDAIRSELERVTSAFQERMAALPDPDGIGAAAPSDGHASEAGRV